MELGILWLIVVVVSAGVAGPVLRAWGLRLTALDHERRLTRLEENRQSDMQREKARARWDSKKFEEEVVAAGKNGQSSQEPWWARGG